MIIPLNSSIPTYTRTHTKMHIEMYLYTRRYIYVHLCINSSRHAGTYYVRLYYKILKINFYEPTDTGERF